MIDPENLRTASLYINNQLLSRGLLRDGQNIDFADPEGSYGGLQTTMGHIISVVNDLILRRDRDAEHRESLSSTLRILRADYQRQTTEFGRQAERLSDTQRRVDTADATERALRTQLKTAEQGIYKLKEEMAKMKSLVAQTRSACANEVRKRDRHIDSLKKAVADAGRVRGGAKNRDIITISVTGNDGSGGDDGLGMPVGATEDEGYALNMETNGFLTELAKGLSEENEGLLALVRRTVDGLREMGGLDRDPGFSHNQGHNTNVHSDLATRPPQKSAEELATELEAIVEHLRSILTNPSFVPIEEVEVRDEAITRLRAGLETMEARWKDAVHMIDGWRRRMVSGGKSVDMEDLQMSLRLSPVRVGSVEETANVEPIRLRLSCVQEEEDEEEDAAQSQQYQEEQPELRRLGSRSHESLRLIIPVACDNDAEAPNDDEDDDDSDSESSIFQDDDIDIDDLDVEEPNVQILQSSIASDSVESSPLPEAPQISPLKDSYSSGNRGACATTHNNLPYHKTHGDFNTIVEENTRDLVVPTLAPTSQPTSPSQTKLMKSPRPQVSDEDDALSTYTASYDSPLFGKSGERISRDRKLFSKQPLVQNTTTDQRVRNTAAIARNRGDKNPTPQQPVVRTRSTRSSGRKSGDAPSSPVAGHIARRTAIDTITTAATSVSAATTTSTAAPVTISTPTPSSAPTSTKRTTRSQQKQAAAESAKRNISAQSSSSTVSSGPKQDNTNGRSPTRQPPTSTSKASSNPKRDNSTGRSPTRRPPASTSASSNSKRDNSAGRSPARQAPASTSSSSPTSSRLPRRPHAQQQQAPLNMATIAAKLAASEREADAARVRAKLRAVRRRGRRSGGTYPKDQGQEEEQEQVQKQEEQEEIKNGEKNEAAEDVDPIKRDLAQSPVKDQSPAKSPVKRGPRRRWSRGDVANDEVDELSLGCEAADISVDRGRAGTPRIRDIINIYENGNGDGKEDPNSLQITKRNKRAPRTGAMSKAASRRRSTLSPWELQGLITGNVGGVESPAR